LSHTLLSICHSRVGGYNGVWSFARSLFQAADYVSPQQVWEYLRPSEEGSAEAVDDPDWPPFCPEVVMAVEECLIRLTDRPYVRGV